MLTTTTLLTALVAPQGPQFDSPVRLFAGDAPVKVEAPGYAAPCWQDIDGDGKKDLIVGQFAGGKMQVFKNLGQGASGAPMLAEGQWLEAEGRTAEVPGVW